MHDVFWSLSINEEFAVQNQRWPTSSCPLLTYTQVCDRQGCLRRLFTFVTQLTDLQLNRSNQTGGLASEHGGVQSNKEKWLTLHRRLEAQAKGPKPQDEFVFFPYWCSSGLGCILIGIHGPTLVKQKGHLISASSTLTRREGFQFFFLL